MGNIIICEIKTMISWLSRLVSFLIANAEQPIAVADKMEIQCPMLMSVMPGRMIMSAPKKPMIIAYHLRARTVSRSKNAAPTVVKSGARKLSAVCSPIGISVTA